MIINSTQLKYIDFISKILLSTITMEQRTRKHRSLANQVIPAVDYIKMTLIVLFLSASIMMYLYEPTPSSSPQPTLPPSSSQNNTNITLDDDNSYDFSPLHRVHARREYKNPQINLCNGMIPSKTLLLTILSRASNVHIREAIRQTWGSLNIYHGVEIRLMFIVGVDDGMLKQIEIEQNIYHDVIQINLPENYPIVSYKELACICWSKYYCPGIQFLFKADEDIHLNTPLLASIVGKFLENKTLHTVPVLYGWFRHKSRVDRSGRYIVTEEEYPNFYYPPYTFGIGYLMTSAGRDGLCNGATRPHRVTRVGDAYITGILRSHSNVPYSRIGDVHYIYSYTLNGPRCQEYFVSDPKLLVCMSSLHSGSNDVADEYVRVWKVLYKEEEASN